MDENSSIKKRTLRRQFFFVPCSEHNGRANSSKKRLANRHVQIDYIRRIQPPPADDEKTITCDQTEGCDEALSISYITKMLAAVSCGDLLSAPRSPAIYRQGLGGIWASGAIPRKHQASNIIQTHVGNWLPPRSSAQEAAEDALCLLELETISGDDNVALAATRAHLFGLEGLRRALSDPHKNCFDLQVLAQELLMCSMYRTSSPESSSKRGHPWEQHILGLIALESRHGPDLESNFGRVAHRALCLQRLIGGLIVRKAFKSTSIQPTIRRQSPSVCQVETITNIGLQIPSLLEQLDYSFNETEGLADSPSLNTLLCRAINIETAVLKWFQTYLSPLESNNSPYRIVLAEEAYPSLNLPTGYSPFSEAFYFTSFLTAHYHTLYWICLLQARAAIWKTAIRLASINHSLKAYLVQAKRASAGADCCADSLSRAVPYMLSYSEGWTSKVMAAAAPLHFAKQWYQERGQELKISWCNELESWMQEKAPRRDWSAVILHHWFVLLWFNPET